MPLQLPLPKALVAVVSLVLSLVAIGIAALGPAKADPCSHIHLSVGQRVVAPGHRVRVSGSTCVAQDKRPRVVQIRVHTRKGWKRVGTARTDRDGYYSKQIRLGRFSQSMRKTRVQVEASKARTSKRLRIAEVGRPADLATSGAEGTAGAEGCPLDRPDGTIERDFVTGCHLVASDTASDPSDASFWGRADCGTYPNALEPDRPEDPRQGGDEDPTATGAAQPDSAYRVLTTYDGDDIDGERCELGLNDIETGPTVFYHEGERRATFVSERLPENFDLELPFWQTVLQMKQAQPSVDADVGPMIEMQAEKGRWIVSREWNIVWSFPARKDFWTRFVFDVVYSQNPAIGSLQVGADLNGDGDFTDPGEMSPVIHGATLATQILPGYPTPVGGPIPSHLRAGIYHDSRYQCPRPTGCSVDVDNVQVLAP